VIVIWIAYFVSGFALGAGLYHGLLKLVNKGLIKCSCGWQKPIVGVVTLETGAPVSPLLLVVVCPLCEEPYSQEKLGGISALPSSQQAKVEAFIQAKVEAFIQSSLRARKTPAETVQ
jgi:hypothetical protein